MGRGRTMGVSRRGCDVYGIGALFWYWSWANECVAYGEGWLWTA